MEGSFGKQLKTLRGRVKQLKQSDVAKRLNVSVASVNYWENDFNKPNMRNLKSLIALLFVEGAFTSAEEIEQFWQATDVPIDEVWLADLIKKDAPDPELALASAADVVALPSQEEEPRMGGEGIVAAEQPPASTSLYQNRLRLLQRVRSFWITGVLEQSLYSEALITLGFQEQPDAVANPWRLIIQESEQASTPLPAGTRITEIYDEAGGELLILGEPGAGKTTLLLELCRELLSRAEQEPAHPIPVIFNLASLVPRKRQSLALWLLEELETKYYVPRSIGSDWISTNQILPLLDGLDEVDASSRPACIQAINAYHQTHSLVPLVVCCGLNDYRSEANRLELSRAVTIAPLTAEQVTASLAQVGERIASLRSVFDHDPVLQELATTPLMLTILILAYQDSPLEEIKGGGSAEGRKTQIFATYTQRMLRRRKAQSRYSRGQTISWLSHLAWQMKQQGQTIFSLEQMQPGWLMKKWQRRLYYGLITGPICGLFVGLAALGTILSFPLIVLITAFIVGLLFGWGSELKTEQKSTKITMPLWIRIRESLARTLANRTRIGVATGLFIGMSSFLYLYLGDFSDWSLGSRIAGALASSLPNGLCIGVCVGLTVGLERKIEPVEASGWSWTELRSGGVRWVLIVIGWVAEGMGAFP